MCIFVHVDCAVWLKNRCCFNAYLFNCLQSFSYTYLRCLNNFLCLRTAFIMGSVQIKIKSTTDISFNLECARVADNTNRAILNGFLLECNISPLHHHLQLLATRNKISHSNKLKKTKVFHAPSVEHSARSVCVKGERSSRRSIKTVAMNHLIPYAIYHAIIYL